MEPRGRGCARWSRDAFFSITQTMTRFDRTKSLQELDGRDWSEPTYPSHLVNECLRLRRTPLCNFSIEDLRIMIGQNIGLAYLVPLALERLHDDPFAKWRIIHAICWSACSVLTRSSGRVVRSCVRNWRRSRRGRLICSQAGRMPPARVWPKWLREPFASSSAGRPRRASVGFAVFMERNLYQRL